MKGSITELKTIFNSVGSMLPGRTIRYPWVVVVAVVLIRNSHFSMSLISWGKLYFTNQGTLTNKWWTVSSLKLNEGVGGLRELFLKSVLDTG